MGTSLYGAPNGHFSNMKQLRVFYSPWQDVSLSRFFPGFTRCPFTSRWSEESGANGFSQAHPKRVQSNCPLVTANSADHLFSAWPMKSLEGMARQSKQKWLAQGHKDVRLGRIQDYLQGGRVSTSRCRSRNFVWGVRRSLAPMHAAGGSPPGNLLNARCSEMRFQANPDGTILPQNDIELLCEACGSLTACWTILRSEIKVNSIHRVFRVNFFAIVHKFVERKKIWWSRAGGSRPPKPTLSGPAPVSGSEPMKFWITSLDILTLDHAVPQL
jgi:hypothetical protein